jgi:hypothetical protein
MNIFKKQIILIVSILVLTISLVILSGCSSTKEDQPQSQQAKTPITKETPLQVAKKMFYYLQRSEWAKACKYVSPEFENNIILEAQNSAPIIPSTCAQAFQSLDEVIRSNSSGKEKLENSFKDVVFSNQEIVGSQATLKSTRANIPRNDLQLVLLFNQWKVNQ